MLAGVRLSSTLDRVTSQGRGRDEAPFILVDDECQPGIAQKELLKESHKN
jgi:hypothetical protein